MVIYVAPTASIIGDVAIGTDSSIWYGAVLRGDMNAISVGESTSIQDNAVVHNEVDYAAVIGNRVTIGHGAIIHGATVEDSCIVGMRAVVGSGAVVHRGSLIAAGAVVTEGSVIPAGTVVAGVPAKVIKPVNDDLRYRIDHSWKAYVELARKSLPSRQPLTGDPAFRARFDLDRNSGVRSRS